MAVDWALAVGLFNILSAALMVGLALFVLRVRPRRPANVALGIFAGAFGVAYAVNYARVAFQLGGAVDATRAVFASALAVASIALLLLARSFPTPLDFGKGSPLRPAAVVFVVVAGTTAWAYEIALPADIPVILATALRNGAFWSAGVVLALRYGAAEDGTQRREIAVVAAALLAYPSIVAGQSFSSAASGELASDSAIALVGAFVTPLAVVVSLWLRNAARAPGSSAPRNLALLALSLALANLLVGVLHSTYAAGTWSAGIARIATVSILVYGMVEHQILGIDAKVRFGLSKSTVAAVFIAVFFVASEAAQQFFGETLGSSYVGILAAGALVFAIAPLSRLADRLAAKAVPVAGGTASHAEVGAAIAADEEAYRRAVRLALRGGITREEERDLALLADRLGLKALRAHELRDEVERATSPGGEGPSLRDPPPARP